MAHTNWLDTDKDRKDAQAALWAIANNMNSYMEFEAAKRSDLPQRIMDKLVRSSDPELEKLGYELLSLIGWPKDPLASAAK